MTAARSFLLKAVSRVEEDLMRANRAVRRANRAANQAVQILKVRVAGEVIRRQQDKLRP